MDISGGCSANQVPEDTTAEDKGKGMCGGEAKDTEGVELRASDPSLMGG